MCRRARVHAQAGVRLCVGSEGLRLRIVESSEFTQGFLCSTWSYLDVLQDMEPSTHTPTYVFNFLMF